MFEFFRRHTRVLQFVLVLLIFPSFVFFGIQGYSSFNGGDAKAVAEVGRQKITQVEWDNALREQIERAQRQMPGLDPSLFQSAEMRRLSLESLLRDRVLLVAADDLHLVTTDDRLDRLFKSDPQFAQLRNPDGSVNGNALVGLGLSSEGFAERLRQDISRRQVMTGITDSALAPAAAASGALDALFQQREVQVLRFEPKDQLAKAAPSDAEVEAYYKDPLHAAMFQAPEEATVDYVVLDPEALRKSVKVSEDDLRKYYAENLKRYTAPEERRASHILIKAEKEAPKAERDAARAKAEALLSQVRKEPSRFAELARKNSDDPGSAEKGGDLDFFGRGAMVKPFEDAAFSLKSGETSGVVESDFGFHVIQVTGARGGEQKPFEAVRAELETEIAGQLAQKRYGEAAVDFTDTVYEQSDSLKPVADKWKLEVRRAEHVARAPSGDAAGALASAKFLEALFASDTLKDKRNTKAIDIGANQLAAGRVVEYRPARLRPFAEVRDQVRGQLTAQRAAAEARKLGVERLAAARAAPATALSENTLLVSRAQPRELPRALVDAVLKAPAGALPALVGVDLGEQGYALARITKVWGRDPSAGDSAKGREQYAQSWASAESQAYYAALKARYKARITDAGMATSREGTANEPR